MLAEYLVRLVTKRSLCAGIPACDAPVRFENKNPVVDDAFDQEPTAFVLLRGQLSFHQGPWGFIVASLVLWAAGSIFQSRRPMKIYSRIRQRDFYAGTALSEVRAALAWTGRTKWVATLPAQRALPSGLDALRARSELGE